MAKKQTSSFRNHGQQDIREAIAPKGIDSPDIDRILILV